MLGFFKKKEEPSEKKARNTETEQFKKFAAQFRPEELSILAVTGANGFNGGKTSGDALWTASIVLTAWMEEDSPDIHRGDHQLGDPVAGLDGKVRFPGVLKPYDDFTPVITVDDAHTVGGGHAVPDAQPAPGVHQRHVVRGGQGDGQPGGDHPPSPGRNGDCLVDAGVEVHGRRAGSGVEGQWDVLPDFRGNRFDFQVHIVNSSNLFHIPVVQTSGDVVGLTAAPV